MLTSITRREVRIARRWAERPRSMSKKTYPSDPASSPASTQVVLGLLTVKNPWVGAMNDGHCGQPGVEGSVTCVKVTFVE